VTHVLVTGANGFVGKNLCNALENNGFSVHTAVRKPDRDKQSDSYDEHVIGDIDKHTNWNESLQGIDCVVHLAARVHVMHETVADPLEVFRAVNTDGTYNLARQAADNGVKRFIYLSSIKVNGEYTSAGKAFTADDVSTPSEPYSISKFDAEQQLGQLSIDTGMEVVIIRPPLVYGPGVKANFLSMMEWLYKGIPLPFGAIHNKRSLVAVDNLVDLIVSCISHPAAANQIFLVSDGEDLSTTDLLRRTAEVLGKPARLLPVPRRFLEFGLKLLGKSDQAQRLCGSLQVDISKTRELLGWKPPVSVDEELRKTAEAFLQDKELQIESRRAL
jgi:nucleoside-diphosphate-sugar epimerase